MDILLYKPAIVHQTFEKTAMFFISISNLGFDSHIGNKCLSGNSSNRSTINCDLRATCLYRSGEVSCRHEKIVV